MTVEQSTTRWSDNAHVGDAVAALLRLPFGRALELSAHLRQYIQGQEHPKLVEEEFKSAWAPNADVFLVSILSQILSKEDNLSIMSILASTALLPPQQERPAQQSDKIGEGLESSVPGLSNKRILFGQVTDSPAYGTIEWGGWLQGEFGAPPSESVEDLLRIPFGDAINLSKELREYLADVEDGPRVEAEFREAWGPQASEYLRAALAQIVSPEFKLLREEKRDCEFSEAEIDQANFNNASFHERRLVTGGVKHQTRHSKNESKL